MKNLITSLVALTLIYAATTSSCTNSTASQKSNTLLDRTDTVGKSAEWLQIETMHNKYKLVLESDSNNVDARLRLVEIFINESRISGNASHYNKLAMVHINKILAMKGLAANLKYQALCHQATILLSLHQFEDAKKCGLAALQLNQSEADIYGILVDASIELGEYNEAVTYCDKMLNIRPDLRSYSRASYVREIYGKNQSAIEAMNLAVEAGAAGMENTEWARVQLGNLYLNKGAIDTAELMFGRALAYRPMYPYALMGLAKSAAYQNKIDSAIMHTKAAIGILSESSFIAYLAQLQAKKGDVAKSTEINKDVLQLLQDFEKENMQEKVAKHHGAKELAEAYLYNNQLDSALKYGLQDLQSRPKNIDANELLSKIYFAKKDFTQASNYANNALATNKQNRSALELFTKIFQAAGNMTAAKKAEQTLSSI